MTHNTRRPASNLARLVCLLALLMFNTAVLSAQVSVPASATTDPWASIEAAITATLSHIQPEAQGLHLDFSLWSGSSLISTGTIGMRRNEGVWFGVRSRSSSFRYLSHDASITCLLETPSDSLLYHARPGDYAPYPIVSIDRDASGGFRLDLTVNYRIFNGSEPALFTVHPETSPYLSAKLRAKYPIIQESEQEYHLKTSDTASAGVVLKRGNGAITGFTALFPVEGQEPYKLQINPLNVQKPFPELPTDWIPAGGRQPTSGIDATIAFCKGFYGILSEVMQAQSQ